MNKDMYNLVKAAMKEGKSLEDVVAEVNAAAKAAEKELKPKTPIADKWGAPASSYTTKATDNGKLSKGSLVSFMMTYFVQNGFNPDACFDTEEKFREHVEHILDAGLKSSKHAADIYELHVKNVSDDEAIKAWARAMGDMVADIFGW